MASIKHHTIDRVPIGKIYRASPGFAGLGYSIYEIYSGNVSGYTVAAAVASLAHIAAGLNRNAERLRFLIEAATVPVVGGLLALEVTNLTNVASIGVIGALGVLKVPAYTRATWLWARVTLLPTWLGGNLFAQETVATVHQAYWNALAPLQQTRDAQEQAPGANRAAITREYFNARKRVRDQYKAQCVKLGVPFVVPVVAPWDMQPDAFNVHVGTVAQIVARRDALLQELALNRLELEEMQDWDLANLTRISNETAAKKEAVINAFNAAKPPLVAAALNTYRAALNQARQARIAAEVGAGANFAQIRDNFIAAHNAARAAYVNTCNQLEVQPEVGAAPANVAIAPDEFGAIDEAGIHAAYQGKLNMFRALRNAAEEAQGADLNAIGTQFIVDRTNIRAQYVARCGALGPVVAPQADVA